MTSAEALIRSPLGTHQYWRHWHQYRLGAIEKGWQIIAQPSGNPSYEPQYLREQAHRHLELMVFLYSAGVRISEIAVWFDGLLRAWEASRELEPSVYPPEIVHSRRTWSINFDLYGESVWLIGLALALEIPDGHWQRLLALIGNEGQDAVLDALIATREPGRPIGAKVLYPKPYARLHAVFTAPAEARPALLRDFVANWYVELDRKATKGRPVVYNRLYWYTLGDENFEGGAYFGRWCIEAAAAAKMFGIDDSLCIGLEHYPGDLLRPDGPSVHVRRSIPEQKASPLWRRWLSR